MSHRLSVCQVITTNLASSLALSVTGTHFQPMWLKLPVWWPPGVLGIWGEWLFIFRELGSTGNYFRRGREQADNFGDLGSLAKKQKNKGKSPFFFHFFF